MWHFLRRQATYFIWGFAITLVICVAVALGTSELIKYIIISAVVGIAVSLALFFLERQFPDETNQIR